MTLLHDQLDEKDLLREIISRKERGRCREADEIYREWSKTNKASSAVTLFHVANCMLLHGLIHDAEAVAKEMRRCGDYGAHPLLWGDYLADLSMAWMKKGDLDRANDALSRSTTTLALNGADQSRLLRNEFFATRIMARQGKPASVHALWNIRQRYERLLYTDGNADATYFRNLSWWLVVFAARFPSATVSIDETPFSPFDYVHADAVYGIPLKSGWTGAETRSRHRLVLEFLKNHPRARKTLARAIVSGRLHIS